MSYWNVKVYDGDVEAETIRGVTFATVHTLFSVFDREGIEAQAMKYNDGGTRMLDSIVNEELKGEES